MIFYEVFIIIIIYYRWSNSGTGLKTAQSDVINSEFWKLVTLELTQSRSVL